MESKGRKAARNSGISLIMCRTHVLHVRHGARLALGESPVDSREKDTGGV
jgi:hypothetical protein